MKDFGFLRVFEKRVSDFKISKFKILTDQISRNNREIRFLSSSWNLREYNLKKGSNFQERTYGISLIIKV